MTSMKLNKVDHSYAQIGTKTHIKWKHSESKIIFLFFLAGKDDCNETNPWYCSGVSQLVVWQWTRNISKVGLIS
jgi:hypothetical protein